MEHSINRKIPSHYVSHALANIMFHNKFFFFIFAMGKCEEENNIMREYSRRITKAPVPLSRILTRSVPNSQEVNILAVLDHSALNKLRPLLVMRHSQETVKKSSRPLRTPLRIIKMLFRTITTCQNLNKMPPRNSQDAVKNCQHTAVYSYKYFKAGLELEFLCLQKQPLGK